MRKPKLLTNPGQSYYAKHTLPNKKDLTPDFGGQFTPARYGQGHWFSIKENSTNFCFVYV